MSWQQDAQLPSRQLVALHRLPDKTQLVDASLDNAAYTDVWNAASKRSRSRRVFSAASEPSLPHQYSSGRERTMRVDVAEMTDSPDRGRRTSNAGGELGDWINKYQKSDHHADRLVRTIVHYEQTTGQRFPGTVPLLLYASITCPAAYTGFLTRARPASQPTACYGRLFAIFSRDHGSCLTITRVHSL